MVNELTTGEKTITWDELKSALTAFGKKHDFEPIPALVWEELKGYFDEADTDNSGDIDLNELQAAFEWWLSPDDYWVTYVVALAASISSFMINK